MSGWQGGLLPLAAELEAFVNHGQEPLRVRRKLVARRVLDGVNRLWAVVTLCRSAAPVARAMLMRRRGEVTLLEKCRFLEAPGALDHGTRGVFVPLTERQPRRLGAVRAVIFLFRALLRGRGRGRGNAALTRRRGRRRQGLRKDGRMAGGQGEQALAARRDVIRRRSAGVPERGGG